MMQVWAASRKKPGERQRNEDSYRLGENFAVVADGVGGSAQPKEASEAVVGSLGDYLETLVTPPKIEDVEFILPQLSDIVAAAAPHGSSTGVGVWFPQIQSNPRPFLGIGVGDSRIYKVSQTGLTSLTANHTRIFGGRAYLTTCFGRHYNHDAVGKVFWGSLLLGERLFLCTDGMWEFLEAECENAPKVLLGDKEMQRRLEWLAESAANFSKDDATGALIGWRRYGGP